MRTEFGPTKTNPACTRLRAVAAVVCLALLAGCSTFGMSTVYYNVPGTTVEQITEQISRRGPQNGHAIGTAETRMSPKIVTLYDNGACRITSAEVKLGMKVTLPQWTELHKADQRTQTAFEALGDHVRWHEQQHVNISNRYVKIIEERLLQVPPQKTCQKTLELARHVFEQGFKEHNKAQLAFDESEREPIRRRLESLNRLKDLPTYNDLISTSANAG